MVIVTITTTISIPFIVTALIVTTVPTTVIADTKYVLHVKKTDYCFPLTVPLRAGYSVPRPRLDETQREEVTCSRSASG